MKKKKSKFLSEQKLTPNENNVVPINLHLILVSSKMLLSLIVNDELSHMNKAAAWVSVTMTRLQYLSEGNTNF